MKAQELWKKVLNFKRLEYPNLCLLAELIICMSGSNSTVERSFNMLRNMLSDKRLSMHHNTMRMLLQIKLNDKIWSTKEREDILLTSLSIYEKKRRLTKITVPSSSRDLEANEDEDGLLQVDGGSDTNSSDNNNDSSDDDDDLF